VYIDDSDVLYNKFDVDYITTGSPPRHPDDHYYCAVDDKDWKVVGCSERKHVVCQKGLEVEILISMSLALLCHRLHK